MKVLIISMFVLLASTLNATTNGIMCQEDGRMNNGPLKEVTLTKNTDGTFDLNYRYVASLNAPNIEIKPLGKNFTCRIDEKNPIAYCEGADTIVQIKDRRETVIPGLMPDEKKVTTKFVDIVVTKGGMDATTITFLQNSCEVFNN